MAREGEREAGNEAGEMGRAASCWSVEAVVRDLNFNPRMMGGLRSAGGGQGGSPVRSLIIRLGPQQGEEVDSSLCKMLSL